MAPEFRGNRKFLHAIATRMGATLRCPRLDVGDSHTAWAPQGAGLPSAPPWVILLPMRVRLASFVLALFSISGLSACVADGDPSPAASADALHAELLVSAEGLSRVSVFGAPTQETNLSVDAPEHALKLEFYPSNGQPMSSWMQHDPRWVRSEFASTGEGSAAEFLVRSGALQLWVPSEGTLKVLQPEGATWAPVGELKLESADDPSADALLNLATDVVEPLARVRPKSNATRPVKLLFLPEGFRESELPTFRRFVSETVEKLGTLPGFSQYPGLFDAYRVGVRSRDSGIDDPAAKLNRDTAFDVSFGDGANQPRRVLLLGSLARATIQKYISRIVWAQRPDVVIYIANTTEWAGGAAGSTLGRYADAGRPGEMVMSMAPGADALLAHELGHAMLGLSDEYDAEYAPNTPCARTATGILNTSPNTAIDLSRLPWADLVNEPVPTRAAGVSRSPNSSVGAYEGAEYCAKGVFRPQATCLMRSQASPLCVVCQRRLRQYLGQRGFVPAS